jgi:hypothetical protein
MQKAVVTLARPRLLWQRRWQRILCSMLYLDGKYDEGEAIGEAITATVGYKGWPNDRLILSDTGIIRYLGTQRACWNVEPTQDTRYQYVLKQHKTPLCVLE